MKYFSLPLLLALFSISLRGATRLEDWVGSTARSNHFNGSILISARNKVQYKESFGFANFQFKVPNKADTRFKIASITKLFTAVLIMQMQQRGTLDINEPIARFLPEYKGPASNKVTLRQLLNHTSGIQNMELLPNIEAALTNGVPVYQRPLTPDQLLNEYCSGPLVNTPGTVFDYNNADYVILGKIIEKISNKSYQEALRENILHPLGMNDSGLLLQRDIVERLADTYFNRPGVNRLAPDLPVYAENWYAAGSMYSTTADLLKFSNALFAGKILKKESLDQMLEPGLDEYGFGTWIYRNYEIGKNRHTIVKRPGRILGAESLIFHVLGTDATIILLSNAATAAIEQFAAEIAGQLPVYNLID